MASPTMDLSSNFTAIIILLINLFVFSVQIPLSVLNALSLCRTSLLHPNLKAILLTQSATFCIFAMGSIGQMYNVVANGMEHWNDGLVVHILLEIGMVHGPLIGHILIIERAMATWMAEQYEQSRKPYFTISWSTIIFFFTLLNIARSFNPNPTEINISMIIVAYCVVALSFAEIIACLLIHKKNHKQYQFWLNTQQTKQNLSERYQLMENIRTARQLSPTFILHFFILLISLPILFIFYYKLVDDKPKLVVLISMVYHLVLSICFALIEFTLIRRHPVLRKNTLFALIKHKFCRNNNNRIGPDPSDCIRSRTTVDILRNDTDRHFEMLRKDWS